MLERLADGEVAAGGGVDDAGGLAAVEAGGGDDELGDVEGEETVAVELAGMALGEHEGLADAAVSVDVTEIGTGEESVVAAGTEHEPAGVGTPVVERLSIVGIRAGHRTILN